MVEVHPCIGLISIKTFQELPMISAIPWLHNFIGFKNLPTPAIKNRQRIVTIASSAAEHPVDVSKTVKV